MKKGIIAGLLAYSIWGFFPIYFHALGSVPSWQTTAHRIVWSVALTYLIILVRGEARVFIASLNWKVVRIYLLAGVLIGANWGTYVWAVASGHVVESSLGYFINPIISVLLAVVFLKEKLRRVQWIVVSLAFIGVAYITITSGQIPWISLILAFTFGLYGLTKKLAPLNSLHGLALEATMIFLPAFIYLVSAEIKGTGAFGHSSPLINLLLALTGIVTVIPLLLFTVGAKRVPLSTIGIMQYATPTFQFLQGVFLFREDFNPDKLVGFIFIWIALIIFTVESFIHFRKPAPAAEMEQLDIEVKSIT